MARRRGLVHIEKSSLASALDRARQHVMGVSPLSSFEESSGGSTWHVRKVWEFVAWRGPRWNWKEIRVAKNMMTTKENIVLPPPMETNNLSLRHQILSPGLTGSRTRPVIESRNFFVPRRRPIPSNSSHCGATIVSDCPVFIIKKKTTISSTFHLS
ncbi:hypothetical protein TNCT_639141 [Trichonephila clavata]|uniref:Uncharacterized protein n=1 Tax=Trichonephila clavata TaxID=2740835 RepID=A0A8X6LID1_TRICU|nr:hypothetical protein TNCT_639141 [Trichonephila clavata]